MPMPVLHSRTSQPKAAARLIVSVGAISVMWLVVLPWIARFPAVESHIRNLDAQGIDPSAMYYTDLKMMDRILRRIEGRKPAASHD